jgi:protoporphyrinogen/coproporphyrinogen III oxidase
MASRFLPSGAGQEVFANLLPVTSRPRSGSGSRTVGTAPRVVVVGGGIAGVAAAAAVRRQRPDVEVTLLEAAPRIGGKLARAEVAGVTVDVGAEAMLNRRPEAVELARSAGLTDRLVHPATSAAHLWTRGKVLPMPRTLMGVPTDARALAESGVISRHGLARAAMDAVLPAVQIYDRDVSVGWLVEERFGREVVDRLVEPLLGGVYAGHAREISARAAVPQVVALLDQDKSMMRAAAAATRTTSDLPVFAGLVGGVGQLPEAVVAVYDIDVRTNATVRDLARAGEGGWNLVVGSTRDAEVVHADAVVLATPARPTGRLLSDVVPDAAMELARIEYASMAVVTLAFRARDLPPTSGSGFLVPPVDGRTVKAATYSFAKWDWVREAGAGADGTGDGVLLLRTSVGRHREESVLQVDDRDLVQAALEDLSDAIGLSVRPVDSHVQRWGGGLPQYAVGHLDRVRNIRASVARVPGLAVCGAAYDGLGIPACIASAELAATQVLEALPAEGE